MSERRCASRVVTRLVYPPIPMRQFDWQAWYDGEEHAYPLNTHKDVL